jgi:hypothetical protein
MLSPSRARQCLGLAWFVLCSSSLALPGVPPSSRRPPRRLRATLAISDLRRATNEKSRSRGREAASRRSGDPQRQGPTRWHRSWAGPLTGVTTIISFDGQSADDNRRTLGFAFVPPDTKRCRRLEAVRADGERDGYVEGKESVSEILAHLADAEIVGGFRMRFILGSPGAPIVAFDQDQWVASGHYDKRDPRKSVEQFRVLREANLASLEREQWEHYGIHPERGQESNRGHRPHVCRTRHQPPAADRKDPPEPLIRQLAASGERDRNLLQQDERVPQAGFHAGLDDGVARLLGVGLNENG